jgi:PEP-CTERM motif
MFRASLAGVALALSASTAMATNISFGTPYIYETSSSTAAASGTSVTPPVGGLGNVGGLCTPGTGDCPLFSGIIVPGPLTGGLISFNTPSSIPGTSYILNLTVSDDHANNHASGFPANTPGDIFQVLLNGGSLGFTSIASVTPSSFSSGLFQTVIGSSPNPYTIGITDLLQPYANGLTDNLPGVLCGILPNGTTGCASPPNGGTVSAGTYGSNLVDFEAFITPTPEPASFALLGSGLLALATLRRRRPR